MCGREGLRAFVGPLQVGACGLRTSPGSQPSFPCRPASQPGGRGAGCAGSTAGRARSNLAARGGPAPLRQQWLLLPALDFPGFIFSQRLVTGLQSALGDRKPSQPPCAAASQGGKEPGFPGRPVAPVTGQVRVLFLLWAVASGLLSVSQSQFCMLSAETACLWQSHLTWACSQPAGPCDRGPASGPWPWALGASGK